MTTALLATSLGAAYGTEVAIAVALLLISNVVANAILHRHFYTRDAVWYTIWWSIQTDSEPPYPSPLADGSTITVPEKKVAEHLQAVFEEQVRVFTMKGYRPVPEGFSTWKTGPHTRMQQRFMHGERQKTLLVSADLTVLLAASDS